MADGKLKKIEVIGGPAQKICDAPSGSDGSWSPEGVILYDGRGSDPIYRVSAAGGTPTVAVKPDASRKEAQVGWPEFLADGKHFMYLAMNAKIEDSTYRIGVLDSVETQSLAPAQTQLAYAPPDRLLFVRDQTLVTQQFDPKTMKTVGDPTPLAERIGTDSVGLATFSISREGTLAYRTGDPGSRLTFVDRTGRELETLGDAGEYSNPVLSPDGRRLAFALTDKNSRKSDVWIRDLTRGVSTRLTLAQGDNDVPLWSPDGATIAFSSTRNGVGDLYSKPANGQGDDVLLLKDEALKFPTDWSRDGRYMAYTRIDAKNGQDVWVLPLFGDRKPIAAATGDFAEGSGVFSPDGRFIAYRSSACRGERSLRAVVSRADRQMADFNRRRERSVVAQRWQGDFLPYVGSAVHGRGHSSGCHDPGRCAKSSLPGARQCRRPGAKSVHRRSGRSADSVHRAARTRRHRPDDGRPQLGRRSKTINKREGLRAEPSALRCHFQYAGRR